ncbi:MAG: CfrBI family restriction endonuclease [Gammaproteobacteria bacterium]|nr:CfrBI family restriction endonuclease [Gammaproteobacteria bacterium]
MALTKTTLKRIIRRLLCGEDYRVEIVSLIDDDFLQFAIEFFKRVSSAKLESREITGDWYKAAFLDEKLDKSDIAISAGLNMKTISNSFNTARKEIVVSAAAEHYQALLGSIKELTEAEDGMDLNLTIKFKQVSVDLNISESLVVINALAVKRAALRGGYWSAVGKAVEKPLMETLCKLYAVPASAYRAHTKQTRGAATFDREVDFYLASNGVEFKCEVKLIGKGNPESADAVIARSSKVFVADKLSDTNKKQLNHLKIEWVELRSNHGFRRFKTALENLGIPHGELDEKNLESNIDSILEEVAGG